MRASNFTDAQKAFIIKKGESGIPVAEICRMAGISQATYFNWKKRSGGLMPSAPSDRLDAHARRAAGPLRGTAGSPADHSLKLHVPMSMSMLTRQQSVR